MTIQFLDEEVSAPTTPTQPRTRRIVFAGEEDAGPAPAPPRDFFSVEDVFSALGGVPESLAVGLPAAAVKGYRGLSIPERSQAIENEMAFAQRVQQEQADREAAGKATTVGSAIREALPSVAFSGVSMLSGLGGGAAGLLGGPAAKVTVPAGAMAASGVASYRMAGADLLYRTFKTLEENKGAPLTDEEKAEAYRELLPIAQDAGLWEAGPEAVSNVLMMKAGKFIFGFGKGKANELVGEAIEKANKTLTRKIAEKTVVGAGTAGAEVISEGVTAIGQYPAEMAAQQYTETGTTEGAPTQYPGGYVQAVKDVAPATLALTGLMGLGAGGVKLASMPFRQQKSPEQIAQDNIDLEAEREANNLMIPPTDEEAKGLQASVERLRQSIAEKKEVYSALEPADPATQQLGMEIRELERAVQLAEAEIAKRVTPESEQARLAREIAAGQEGLVTKTGKQIDPELTNSIGKMVGLRREGGLTLEEGFAYRSVSEGEVGSIAQEGYMITDPRLVGKEKKPRGQTTQKMFSEFNPDAPNAAYGKGDIVLRVRKENVPVGTKGQAVREGDVEVLSYDGTQWVAQTPAEFAQSRKPTAEATTVTPAPVSETITRDTTNPEQMTSEEFNSQVWYQGVAGGQGEFATGQGLYGKSPWVTLIPGKAKDFATRRKTKGGRVDIYTNDQLGETAWMGDEGPIDIAEFRRTNVDQTLQSPEDTQPAASVPIEEAENAHRYLVSQAVQQNKPVAVAAVQEYGIDLPQGYTQQGDLFVYQEAPVTTPAPAAAVTPAPAAPTSAAPEIISPAKSRKSLEGAAAPSISSLSDGEVVALAEIVSGKTKQDIFTKETRDAIKPFLNSISKEDAKFATSLPLKYIPNKVREIILAAPAEAPGAPVSETITPAGEAAPVTTPAPAEAVTPAPAETQIVVRRGEAGTDTSITLEDKAYRGMTEDEFNNTILKTGDVESRGDFRFAEEGTNFAEKFEDAESYVNFGRDDPRKTNKPTFIVEVDKQLLNKNRRGDYEASGPIAPVRIWKITPRDGELVATEINLPRPTAAEPVGIAIGNRVKTKTTPQSFVVEEVLPQSEREVELGEQYYRIKNERTGEVQTVEANDIKPIKISTATKKMAPVRVEEKATPVPEADRYTFDEAGIRAIEFFGGKAPDGLLIVNDTTNPNYEMKAGYDPETGDIILNRAYIRKGESIEDILTHELGHYIFSDTKFQADFKNFLDSMPDDTRAEIEAIINQSYNKDTNQTQIEERQVLAFTSLVKANKDTLSKWETIKNTIKRWINKIFGTNIKLSDEGAMAVFNVGFKRFKSGERIIRAMNEGTLKMAAEPRKPAAEEQPTGPAPESPEGQSVPQALGNGIDIGPEDNMPINRKIDSHLKNFLFLRGFFESASDRLRRNGFVKLGDAIRMYFDQAQRRLGDANKIMLPAMEAYKAVPAARKKQIEQDFETFFAAQENGRDTDAIRKEMDPIARRIVDAWQKFGEESGKENQRVGVKVFDPKSQSWRKIGRVEKFWPRRLKPEYQRALMDPDKYAKEYNEIVEALLESGQIKDAKEAEKYLREYSPEATKNDYFSGIEKARGKPLPESLYDYSMQVMPDYIARWAQHVSRIEQFGQKTSEQSMTLWDREMTTTRDPRTRDYIQAARERVEGYFPNDPFLKGTSALNIWATALQLGNPASAFLNLIGGSTLNAMIGQPGALGSYVSSFAELRNLGKQLTDAKEKGIIGRDLMNIVGDHQAILETNKVAQAGQKAADILLKWSGFTPAEQMIRTQSLIIGKSFVRNALNAFSNDPRSSFARRASVWMTRNGFDLDKLIVENGSGPETDRILRYFANISQGSYTIDQVPIFIDTPIGRFLFKYQKFSTQVMRMSWKNTFEPLLKAMTGKGETMQVPDKTRQLIYRLLQEEARSLGDNRRIDIATIPKTVPKAQGRALALIPAMMWLGAAYVGGEVLLRARDILFGVLMKGPEYEDILKELKDDEKAAALYLASERAWYNLIGIGALGLIGNYAQFFLDWQDRERVKNPLEPPALGIVKDTAQFIQNIVDQGEITAGDIDNYTRSTLSAYRTTQKLAQSTAGFLGLEDIPGVKQEMFRREVNNINKYARRWAEESGIEYRMRRPTDITASPRTPVNRKIASYLQTGNPDGAAVYAKAYLNSLPKADRLNAIQSISTGARNRQPLRLGSGPMDEAERKAFLRWLKDKVSEERYARIAEMDKQYQRDYKKFLRMLPNR